MSPMNGHFRLSVRAELLNTRPLRTKARSAGSAIPTIPWPISEPIDRLLDLLFDRFHRYPQLYVVTDRWQEGLHIEVAPFQRHSGFCAESDFPFWAGSRAVHLHRQRHRFGNAAQGKIAGELVILIVHLLDRPALEGDSGRLFGVYEVRALDSCVSIR